MWVARCSYVNYSTTFPSIVQANVHRSAVLTLETIATLSNYLGFRHFYRHIYSFFLD